MQSNMQASASGSSESPADNSKSLPRLLCEVGVRGQLEVISGVVCVWGGGPEQL